jgi:23S rRNA (cytosine1962-C5)-methyltransferase
MISVRHGSPHWPGEREAARIGRSRREINRFPACESGSEPAWGPLPRVSLIMTTELPRISLTPEAGKRRAVRGHPWIFSNEINMSLEAKAIPPGSVVHVVEVSGRVLGAYHFNPHSLIAARLLSRSTSRAIDANFLAERFSRALALREHLFDVPYYRLAHAEGDQLPGLIVDRYGDTLVVQANTAGMELLKHEIVKALIRVTKPTAIVWAADSAARKQEGLEPVCEVVHGAVDGPVTVRENGVIFIADVVSGQKTGWFFDHRANRAFAANLVKGGTLLDLYAYAGGFGITAAVLGASAVTSVDRASGAINLATTAAAENGVADKWQGVTREVFAWLEKAEDRFDVVVGDPPAFAKTKKDIPAATKGYAKLAKLAAQRVNPGGFLCLASCSYHMTMEAFQAACADGIRDGGRGASLIHTAGAGPDHPVHPQLAQTAYLKFVVYRLD